MTVRHAAWARQWTLAVILIGAVAAWQPTAGPAWAGDLAKLDNSLPLVPKSAAFYSSSMRLGEQLDIVAKSRAWARLKAMPSVQEAMKLYQQQCDNPNSNVAKFHQALEHPAVADLIGLLKDMFAQETFVFGDDRYPQAIGLMQEVSNAVRYGSLVATLSRQREGSGEGKLQARLLLTALADHVDAIEVPTTVVGFKITDKARAGRNLVNFEGLVAVASMAAPQLNVTSQRKQIGGSNFFVTTLDGAKISWDEFPVDKLQEIEATPGDADKVLAKLKTLKLVTAAGIRGDYLLVSVGPSTDCLERLGSGGLLIERPELAPLKKFTDQRLAAISYASLAMNQEVATSKKDIDALVNTLEDVLPDLDLPKADQDEILRDARSLAKDVKRVIPEPGAALAFAFLTGEGAEGYSYNWSKNLPLDGSKPLTLLDHVGGNPILAAVWRAPFTRADYNLVVKWCEIGYDYFEKYAVPEMSSHDRKEYERFKDLVAPLPERLDRANRELLIPALADGQGALVLDAKLKVRKLFKEMPDPGKPMPILEPAMVVGVSNAGLLGKACDEYRAVFEEFLDAIREVDPGSIPDFEIPEPKVKKTGAGTLYAYPPPEHCGVDKKIVPTLGLSDSVAVAAMSRAHAQRLLDTRSLASIGVLTDTDRPSAATFLFNFAGLVDAARPWVELAAREAVKKKMHLSDDSSEERKTQADSIVKQVHTVLDVLQVLRSVTAEARFDNGAFVTHTLVEIRDLD